MAIKYNEIPESGKGLSTGAVILELDTETGLVHGWTDIWPWLKNRTRFNALRRLFPLATFWIQSLDDYPYRDPSIMYLGTWSGLGEADDAIKAAAKKSSCAPIKKLHIFNKEVFTDV